MCELLATISAVHGITCDGWMYQIITQSITERLPTYSSEYYNVLFQSFQSLGPVLWVDSRYHFWVLVSFLHVLLVIHCMDLGKINIGMGACAPNPLEKFDVVNNSF